MRLVLASRKSDLARIQAYAVGQALKKAHPELNIQYQFRESLGDKNLSDPLWQMPEKGVFTQDFHEDLIAGRVDLVVHSWKDLPTEMPADTKIAATLPRADMRDVFLFKKKSWTQVTEKKVLRIFSSSPRRAYNLAPFFKRAFPAPLDEVAFETVRGNVPTRIAKLLESRDVHGLIVAKAALDRLLSAETSEVDSTFAEMARKVRAALDHCRFMILPLRENPAAAAQGALAVEIATGRATELEKILATINHAATFETVSIERARLAGLGGGCHQKIGVACLRRPYGDLLFIRAFTDRGEKIDDVEFISHQKGTSKTTRDRVFPFDPADAAWFERIPVDADIPAGHPLWISKAYALPEGSRVDEASLVWVSGWETWKKLAARGIWVTGSSESLGEDEDPRLDILLNGPVKWTKLTHEAGRPNLRGEATVTTYRLEPKKMRLDETFAGKTHFYWTSGSNFLAALERCPEIKKGRHFCGPGNTYLKLREVLGPDADIGIFPSHALWLREVCE